MKYETPADRLNLSGAYSPKLASIREDNYRLDTP